MKLSFKEVLTLNQLQSDIIEELSFHTTKLYNIINYELREKEYNSYKVNNIKYKNNYHVEFMHSHTYQQLLKKLENNWKSYFNSLKDYNKNANKYKSIPRQPKFKNTDKNKNEIIFTNFAIRLRNNILKLSLSKKIKEKFSVESLDFVIDKKLQSILNFNKTNQVILRYDKVYKKWEMIIIYEKNEVLNNNATNIMSIDLGLTNLAACTNLENSNTLIINGKPLKSVNRKSNNDISILQSLEMKSVGNNKYKNTKRILKIKKYRY